MRSRIESYIWNAEPGRRKLSQKQKPQETLWHFAFGEVNVGLDLLDH